MPPLEVYMFGEVDFLEIQRLQRRIVYDLGEQDGAALILCEHPLTISVGRTGSWAHIACDHDALKGMGIGVHWINRGGGCVLHGRGQLAAYVAMPLGAMGVTLFEYLDRLNQAVIAVLAEFDLEGQTRPDLPGVFSGRSRIASVGVAVSRDIAYHGLTLNVGPYLEMFRVIHEPGLDGAPLRQTSMESRRQRPALMPKVKEALIRRLEQGFGLEEHHLYTSHPMLRSGAARSVHVPSLG